MYLFIHTEKLRLNSPTNKERKKNSETGWLATICMIYLYIFINAIPMNNKKSNKTAYNL